MAVLTGHQPKAPPAREILELADGVELVGEYEGSGFNEPPLLARRADGQMIQLTWLLYLVAAASDDRRDVNEVADIVSEHYGRRVSTRNVQFLADERLRPLGVLALRDGTTPELPKREAMFALRCRRPLVSERAVNALARMFTWLHWAPLVTVILAALAVFDVWLFGVHGIASALRTVIYEPTLLLAVLATTVVAAMWHEIGHASACRYGGARPGVMGVGIYLVWPAFYCDVTDAYRLNRAGRLRTDLGGVYFNGIVALAAGLAFFLTGHEALLLVAFVQHIVLLQQLIPLLRFDGYYVLSDLTGVPDILSRIKPILRSLIRGRRSEPRVDELKPWVRIVVTAYLVALVPTLVLMLAWTLVSAPRIFATVHDSFGLQLDRIGAAHGFSAAAVAVLRLAALAMPLAATSVSLSRSGRMALLGLGRWSRGSLPRRAVAVAAVAALAGVVAYIWWPNGDYAPIRPGERGTVGEMLSSIPDYGGGRPSFTEEREQQYAPAPTVREEEAAAAARPQSDAPDPLAPVVESPTPESTPAAEEEETPEPTDRGDDPVPTATPFDDAPAGEPSASEPTTNVAAPPSPTAAPSETATAQPTETPTAEPSATPTAEPTATPTAPSAEPTATPETMQAPAATESAAASPTPTASPEPNPS